MRRKFLIELTNLTDTKTCPNRHNEITLIKNHVCNTITMSTDKPDMKIILGKVNSVHGRQHRYICPFSELMNHINCACNSNTITD